MAKQGSAIDNPAAVAEWLPLLGAICQVLASISDAGRRGVENSPDTVQGHKRTSGTRAAPGKAG